MRDVDWQEALWAIPNYCGRAWDWTLAAIALAAAVALFLKLILGHRYDALLLARSIGGMGLLGTFASTLNSGWTKWSIACLVIGMAMSTFLVTTNWCNRPDKSVTMPQAFWRWLGCGATWVVGAPQKYDPTKEV